MEIQLFFSISILPLIASKRWNFSNNLDFSGKIVAKLRLRSHFLSICNNMAVKQQINHLHNGIFHSINLCCYFSILLVSLDTITFLDTHVCMFFLLLAVIWSKFYENPEWKDWVTQKNTYKNLCQGHHFFGCTPSLLCHVLSLFPSTPCLSPTSVLRRKNFFLLPCLQPLLAFFALYPHLIFYDGQLIKSRQLLWCLLIKISEQKKITIIKRSTAAVMVNTKFNYLLKVLKAEKTSR